MLITNNKQFNELTLKLSLVTKDELPKGVLPSDVNRKRCELVSCRSRGTMQSIITKEPKFASVHSTNKDEFVDLILELWNNFVTRELLCGSTMRYWQDFWGAFIDSLPQHNQLLMAKTWFLSESIDQVTNEKIYKLCSVLHGISDTKEQVINLIANQEYFDCYKVTEYNAKHYDSLIIKH